MLGHPLAAQNSTVNVGVNNGLSFATGISTPSIGALSGLGNVSLQDQSSNPVELTAGGNNANTSYYGTLSGSGGGLTKTGGGLMVLGNLNTYTGPTTISNGTLQLASANVSGITSSNWTIQYVGGSPCIITGSTANLTTGGGGFSDVWCNTPLAGLTNQPWTASFTYLDANAKGLTAGSSSCRPAGPSARTDGNTAWETVSGYGPVAAPGVEPCKLRHLGCGLRHQRQRQRCGSSPISNVNMVTGGTTGVTVAYNGSSTVTVSMTQGTNTWSKAYTGMNLASTLGGSGTLVYFGFGGGQGARLRDPAGLQFQYYVAGQ